MTDTLRVYVACLASYNAGTLHGEWIDIGGADDADDIGEAIAAMLARSPEPGAEEWAIHDLESPVDFGIGEHDSPAALAALAAMLDEYDADALSAGAALWDRSEGPEGLRGWMDRYRGRFDSLADYAEETFSEAYTVPAPLDRYIDWQSFGRDLELGGDITTERAAGKLHVFDNHG